MEAAQSLRYLQTAFWHSNIEDEASLLDMENSQHHVFLKMAMSYKSSAKTQAALGNKVSPNCLLAQQH